MIPILTQLLTGKDNQTHDVVRWCAALAVPCALLLEAHSVFFLHAPFDMQAFGLGIGTLLTGVGAALNLKAATEPAPSE